MDAQILIELAKLASTQRGAWNHQDRMAFQIGYLEETIRQICNLFTDAEEIMYQQKKLIEEMSKARSASL